VTGAIETGTGEGYLARVTEEGRVETSTKPASATVHRTSVTVQTTSGLLVGEREGRRSFHGQNQGANPVHLRFEAAAATNADWLVAPGGVFRAEEFPYEGEVRAIAIGGTSVFLVLELA
jgi:hypothetical protein